jgi:hypothetical protein
MRRSLCDPMSSTPGAARFDSGKVQDLIDEFASSECFDVVHLFGEFQLMLPLAGEGDPVDDMRPPGGPRIPRPAPDC